MSPGQGATLDSIRILWELGVIGSLTDADLLDRFLADSGDASETAFAILVERHGPAVRRVCLDVLGDPHDAQDAAQAVFLVLARRTGSIRKPGALGSWLHGVALRVARRSLAENARRREVERQAVRESAIQPTPPSCPELHEELDRLPEKYRAPIVLCYLEGQTQEQAARSLGWPLGTVQTRLHRGRQTLHGRLVRRGIVPAGLAAAGLNIPRTVAAPIAASWIRATARAAARFVTRESLADLVPASVSALAQGVLTTLFRSTLKLTAVGLFAASLGVIGVGMAREVRDCRARPPSPDCPGR
jgi:RNA polymerase sigma factor (sigma-70 family)